MNSKVKSPFRKDELRESRYLVSLLILGTRGTRSSDLFRNLWNSSLRPDTELL